MASHNHDEETRRAVDEIARRIELRFPGVVVEAHESEIAHVTVIELFAPDRRKQPMLVTLSADGRFQVEVFPMFEHAEEQPAPLSASVERALEVIFELARTGVKGNWLQRGYPAWPGPVAEI